MPKKNPASVPSAAPAMARRLAPSRRVLTAAATKSMV